MKARAVLSGRRFFNEPHGIARALGRKADGIGRSAFSFDGLRSRGPMLSYCPQSTHKPMIVTCLLMTIVPSIAADVTPARLANVDAEPQNWLMNHRTYDAQRYSPLSKINKSNVGGLKLAYAVAIGGTSAIENLEATPLAEDGFLYVVDQWGVLYKIDSRSGAIGRILWRMDPGQEKLPLSNRGAALWGNLVITVANYPARMIATDKETGKVAWESDLSDGQTDVQFTAAPLAIKNNVVLGASGGDRGVRDFIVSVDAATGKLAWRRYVIPAPGDPGSETWKDKFNAWQTGGGSMWVTGSYDIATNQVLWGTGNPTPAFDASYRPGDNLYTDSLISWNPDTGRMNWYFQYTPGDRWNFDEAGTHILIDGNSAGQRTLVTHPARNGFLYTIEPADGRLLFAKPYIEAINWTRGIDQVTGKPLDYDLGEGIQAYSTRASAADVRKLCPTISGAGNFWPASYSRRTKLLYLITSVSSCDDLSQDIGAANGTRDWRSASFRDSRQRISYLVVADPFTGKVMQRVPSAYQNNSGVLSTGGGVIFTGYTDGSFAAYDDTTLEQLWRINVGTGFAAPPMTFEADGKQYVAILSGLSRASRNQNNDNPELRNMRNQTMLFVFGL
jgi:alcohol dehydrogenase (cytochrome c)